MCDVPFGLSLLSSHYPSGGPALTKILGRTPYRHCQQLDCLCNCTADVRTWLYSSKYVLHLHIRVQLTVVAQGTNTHEARAIAKESDSTGDGMNRMEFLRRCALRKSWGGGRLFYVGALVAFFGTVLGTCHGLVIPTIMDLPVFHSNIA